MELLIFQEDCLKCAIHASWVFDTRVCFFAALFLRQLAELKCVLLNSQPSHYNALDLFHVIVFDLTMVLMRPFFVISTYFFILYFESNLKSEVDLKSDVCQSSPLVDLATNADIRVISFGVFQNQGWATFPQLDIARLPCSDSNASEPTSKKHPGHRFIKVLHLQVGILPVQAGELSPVRQELSFSLHGEQGPHLGHVLKLNIHKSNRLQLHLDQMLYVYISFRTSNQVFYIFKLTWYSSFVGR